MDFGTEPLLDAHTKLKHLACNFCLFNGERADLDAHVNAAHPGKLTSCESEIRIWTELGQCGWTESRVWMHYEGVEELQIPRSKKHEDPAEIAAWIAARKKKYPTKANIQKKIQEKQEKLASGMLVSTATQSSLKRDRATRLVQEGEADDDDAGKRGEDDPNAMSLEEGEEEATSPVHGGAGAAQRKRQFPCKYFAMGKCKNGDDCMYMHIKEATVLKKDRPALGGGKRRNLRDMLVESQIRRQNNIILQCIRFVLNDKRFGVGPPQPK
ncbi:hypothetical protein BC830DRAFT_1083521 [Chytriomyces sp. MP71]|nr:hypothetical protein BC830DRAFT_1083521 [Chytriomyces sp. MP71]